MDTDGPAACSGDPVFLPRDESSAWAWLPLGIRDTFDAAGASTARADGDIHFAFGDAAKGATGFRLTHQQAIAAQAVALAAGSPPPRAVAMLETRGSAGQRCTFPVIDFASNDSGLVVTIIAAAIRAGASGNDPPDKTC